MRPSRPPLDPPLQIKYNMRLTFKSWIDIVSSYMYVYKLYDKENIEQSGNTETTAKDPTLLILSKLLKVHDKKDLIKLIKNSLSNNLIDILILIDVLNLIDVHNLICICLILLILNHLMYSISNNNPKIMNRIGVPH